MEGETQSSLSKRGSDQIEVLFVERSATYFETLSCYLGYECLKSLKPFHPKLVKILSFPPV